MRFLRLAILSIALPLTLTAQRGGQAPPTPPDTFTEVSWRNIGPLSTGRMVAVAGSVARPDEYYFGTTGGGVWKTTDGGKTTIPVTDNYFGGTIGAIAIAETNPDIVYVGGGETPIRGNVSYGDGMWKTTDGGKTWTSLGLTETQYIGRVRLDPANPDIVYVAALGHVFGANKERGVYKSTDGGKNWKQVLFRNDSTGAIELVMDPKNSSILYAALWEANRSPWSLKSGGPGGGIFKSTDAGETWTEITTNPGMPTGLFGNIGLTVSPINSNLVWALIENEPNGGVYKSSDAGATWTHMSGDRNIRQRAWYYSKIYASPIDTQTLTALNVSPQWSSDGGKTWRSGFGGGDNHDMWIAPDGKRIAVAHDNGTVITTDSGKTRTAVQAATGQLYHVHLTTHSPTHVCGAKQDAGSQCGPIRGPIPVPGAGGRGGGAGGGRGAAPAPTPTPANGYQEFYSVAGGESGYIASSPLNPDISYGGNYGGSLDSRDRITGRTMTLDPWPLNPMGHDAKDSKYRFQWTYPIVNSPHERHALYVGSNVVFKSDDDGMNFHAISPDLTRHDPKTLGASGGPISKDQTSVEYYGTVFTLDESPIVPGLIWTGSDDGLVYLTRNGGTSWSNVTPKGLPEWMRMSIIAASPHDPATAWLAGNRYQLDDMHPYLYRTTDYGVTWTKITDGIPADEFTRAIREDLARPGMLYAATERSMYLSYDRGDHWQSLKKNLPPVPVHDIALKDDDMAIATHGRAFWVMEHLEALRNAPDAAAAKTAGKDYLYTPALTPRAGGVLNIRYDLVDASQPVSLELRDRNGKLFKKFSSTDTIPAPTPPVGCFGQPAGGGGGGGRGGAAPTPPRVSTSVGTNRYAFNLRYPNASTFQCMILWNNSMNGPTLAPGQYFLTMRVGTKPPITKQVRITRDPRSDASDADVGEQVALALRVHDRLTETNDGVKTIRSIRSQLEAKLPAMESNTAFKTLAKNLMDSLSTVEDSLYQTKNRAGQDPLNFPIRLNDQLGGLNSFVQAGERKPTRQSVEIYGILAPKVAAQMARLKYITGTMLPRVNRALKAEGQEEIVPTTVEGK